MSALRFAVIQLDVGVDESAAARLERAFDLVRAEAQEGADVVLLPEMWARGYFDFGAYEACAEPVDGPIAAALSELAAETGATVVGGSIVERDEDALYNTALVFAPGGERSAAYRKIHLYSYDAREAELLEGGSEIVTVGLGGGLAGLSICYDLRFPEHYRAQVDAGAEILIIVSAWPTPRIEAWRTLLRARAIENQAAVVACNSAGSQNGREYGGRSAIVDPWGEVMGELDERPAILRGTIDLEEIRAARGAFPALADRRL